MRLPRTSAIGGIALALLLAPALLAGLITIPNASFEAPPALFPTPNINSWAKTPKPDWYDDGGGTFTWSQLTGTFRNPAPSASNHIDNCDGLQAIWLFAVPEVCLFQDYESMDWNDTEPTHEFDATYEVGKSYQLTVGVIGTGGNMLEGVTLELSLFYRDANSNRVPVATTILTNTPTVFSNNTHFVDCYVNVPVVQTGDAWAGKKIGIQFLSTVSFELQGGYWDLDHVRLNSTLAPKFQSASYANGQFQATIQSETNLVFEIVASTNLFAAPTAWTRLGVVTNATGTFPFVDTNANFQQRYYQVRPVP